MKSCKLIHEIAVAIGAVKNFERRRLAGWEHADRESAWHALWCARLAWISKEYLPSGSGIDAGTMIDLEFSKPDKIRLSTAFHHMNDGGYYDGWTSHFVTLTPSFIGSFDIAISGRDRNTIKDHLAEIFRHALDSDFAGYPDRLMQPEPVAPAG